MSIFTRKSRKPVARKAAKPSIAFTVGPFEVSKDLSYGLVEEEPYGTMLHIMPRDAKPFRVGLLKAERIADAVIDGRKRG